MTSGTRYAAPFKWQLCGTELNVRAGHLQDGDGDVRNLGKPVELAERYYHEGADEVTFLKYVVPTCECTADTSSGGVRHGCCSLILFRAHVHTLECAG